MPHSIFPYFCSFKWIAGRASNRSRENALKLCFAFAFLMISCLTNVAFAQTEPSSTLKYSFTPQPIPGYTPVQPDTSYSSDRGYGFDLGSKLSRITRPNGDPQKSGFTTGQSGYPFFFSTKLAPGAYRVTVTLGDAQQASTTTIKSETRRLMLEGIYTDAGQFQTRSFLVHIRIPQIPGATGNAAAVALKQRERDPVLFVRWDKENKDPTAQIPFTELDWDEKLTLEFSGERVASFVRWRLLPWGPLRVPPPSISSATPP